MFISRIAYSRTSTDRFPIMFRSDCERTLCDWQGCSEGLLDVILRLDKAGYDLISYDEAKRRFEARRALDTKSGPLKVDQ